MSDHLGDEFIGEVIHQPQRSRALFHHAIESLAKSQGNKQMLWFQVGIVLSATLGNVHMWLLWANLMVELMFIVIGIYRRMTWPARFGLPLVP